MESLCRICGTHSLTLVGIFDQPQRRQFEGEVEPNLADMVTECAEVSVDPGDSLPQKICRNCVQDAQIAYRFKRRCEQSYQKFYLAIVSEPEIKRELEDPEDNFTIEELYDNAVEMKPLVEMSANKESTKEELPKKFERQTRLTKKTQEPRSESIKDIQHQRNQLEHNNSDPSVECLVCQKVFSTARGLDIHKCQPMKKRPFECPHCPQTFTHNHYLKAHRLIHPADESGPHKCTMCRAGFATKASLKVHINSHLGDRPHSCPICNSNFRSEHALKVHIRNHTGEKPYQCPHCPKAFSDNNYLAKHRRRHSDERPYKCLVCLQDFRERHHLKRHVLGKHGEQ